jgi:hypothetical protein
MVSSGLNCAFKTDDKLVSIFFFTEFWGWEMSVDPTKNSARILC